MNQKIILLVEDNPDDEELTIRTLKKNNISNPIVVAHDGAEALDYFFGKGAYADRDLNEMPVLTMLDIKMPKVSGLEVLKQIRANETTRLLPIVILTSSDEEEDIMKSYELGVNSYVRKPVNFPQFQSAIRQLAVYWLLLNEVPDNINPSF